MITDCCQQFVAASEQKEPMKLNIFGWSRTFFFAHYIKIMSVVPYSLPEANTSDWNTVW